MISGATLVETFDWQGRFAISKYRLDNGLVVLLLPDAQAPVFSYQTWFRVGSRHEQIGKSGIAHLFEHLMFKETKNTPAGVFDRTMEGFGARVNAATWLDWTYYHEDVPKAHLDAVIALEADRMENMVLNEAQLEAEREVVINERRERVDNDPNGKLGEVLWELAFPSHPYGHPTIGFMADIEQLSLADCTTFYERYYSPNNAVLVVVGDFESGHCLERIIGAYGHLRAQDQPQPDLTPEPVQTEVRRREERLSLTAERLIVGYKAPAMTSDDFPALEILNEILSEGDSSRLQRALVTDGELASGFSASVPPFRETGLYEISVDLREDETAEAAEEVLLSIFAQLSVEGVTAAELSKARNKLETRFYQGLQTAQQRANSLGFWEVTGGDFKGLFNQSPRYAAVCVEDVRRVASDILRPENRTVVVGRPLTA